MSRHSSVGLFQVASHFSAVTLDCLAEAGTRLRECLLGVAPEPGA